MGLLTFTAAGSGFILIGVWESLSSVNPSRSQLSDPSKSQLSDTDKERKDLYSSVLSFIVVCVFSSLFVLNSLVSVLNAVNLSDRIGSALQLPVLAVVSLFFLYSVLGLLMSYRSSLSLPSSVLDLVLLFAFVEEFLLYYLQRKDTSGIENRYFDLLLVPILGCVISTVLGLRSMSSGSNFARLGRGVGLILQGMWFLQMGLSFYTNLIAHGCSLHEKSRGNYTIRCKSHEDYHRARAIATLQFNCHLALLVALVVGFYSVTAKRNGIRGNGDFIKYRPLGAEMQPMEVVSNFTLDSDEDDIREEENVAKPKVEVGVNGLENGHGSHE
ncbi:uncharacterized protein LOC123198281 [Mangifera indica]|uniref:uncharacterized protein LOC123198281 n=1 Tax=Mangifera indica TaxID=29780 RepID=UPI001CFA69C9|nr:uncharacterized protein LOC123198281 [Mangifera indica]XP_044468897.1 uncharacterized protein LOC123198281 [Mangifera indica]XP_044468898.1 uncharacterized protein LOC123198281 [Mangifera indica]XP_044468899.1 uncharacterized protein LOC123198281 [Mangifera indica]